MCTVPLKASYRDGFNHCKEKVPIRESLHSSWSIAFHLGVCTFHLLFGQINMCKIVLNQNYYSTAISNANTWAAKFYLSLCSISFWVLRLLNPWVHPRLLIHACIMGLPNLHMWQWILHNDMNNQNVFSFHDKICTEINILITYYMLTINNYLYR